MASEKTPYQPKDALGAGITGVLVLGTAGTAISAVQNTLTKTNVGPWGIFTRSGGTITTFGMLGKFPNVSVPNSCIAAMGGSYEFFRYAAANLRQKDDSYNPAIGGFVAGSVMGLRCMI